MNKAALAFLVTWKISGFSLIQCQDVKLADPVIGMCVSKIELERSASFGDKAKAEAVFKELKSGKTEAYKVSDVHMYSESGAK